MQDVSCFLAVRAFFLRYTWIRVDISTPTLGRSCNSSFDVSLSSSQQLRWLRVPPWRHFNICPHQGSWHPAARPHRREYLRLDFSFDAVAPSILFPGRKPSTRPRNGPRAIINIFIASSPTRGPTVPCNTNHDLRRMSRIAQHKPVRRSYIVRGPRFNISPSTEE